MYIYKCRIIRQKEDIVSNFDDAIKALRSNKLAFLKPYEAQNGGFVCVNRTCPFGTGEDNGCGSWCLFFGVSDEQDMSYLRDLSDKVITELNTVCVTCRYTNTLIGTITKEDSSHA